MHMLLPPCLQVQQGPKLAARYGCGAGSCS